MPGDVFRVLAVCTGNLCRSPMIERVLAARLAEPGGGAWWEVSSAGTHAVDGESMHPYTAEVLAESGYDTGGFAARRLDVDLLADADLVIAATAGHRATALDLWPAGLGTVFVLSELAALSTMAERPRPAPSLAARARAAVVCAGAARSRTGGGRPRDLDDPMGLRLPAYRRCLDEVERDVGLVAGLLLP